MTRRRRLLAAIVFTGAAFATVVHTAAADNGVRLAIDPTNATLALGEEVTLSITLENHSSDRTSSLAVHLDVTDPSGSSSVDPEDWSSTLTRQIGVVAPGGTHTIDWTLQPISGGAFRAYAVAMSIDDSHEVWASNAVIITVEERRSLNPAGILPVAIAAPAGVGLLLATRIRPSRRND